MGDYGGPSNPSPLSLVQQGASAVGDLYQSYENQQPYHPLVQRIAKEVARRIQAGESPDDAMAAGQRMMAESVGSSRGLGAQGQSATSPQQLGLAAPGQVQGQLQQQMPAPSGQPPAQQQPQPQQQQGPPSLGALAGQARRGLGQLPYMQGQPVQQGGQAAPPPQQLSGQGGQPGPQMQAQPQRGFQPGQMQTAVQPPASVWQARPPQEDADMSKPFKPRDLVAMQALTPILQMTTKSDMEKMREEGRQQRAAATAELRERTASSRLGYKWSELAQKFEIETRKMTDTEARDATNAMLRMAEMQNRLDVIKESVKGRSAVAGQKAGASMEQKVYEMETRRRMAEEKGQKMVEVAQIAAAARVMAASRGAMGASLDTAAQAVLDAAKLVSQEMEDVEYPAPPEGVTVGKAAPYAEGESTRGPDSLSPAKPAAKPPSQPDLADTAKKTTKTSNDVVKSVGPGKMIRVRKKSNNATGSIPEKNFDPALYERL